MTINKVYNCSNNAGVLEIDQVIASITPNVDEEFSRYTLRREYLACKSQVQAAGSDNYFAIINDNDNCTLVPNDITWTICMWGLSGSYNGFDSDSII